MTPASERTYLPLALSLTLSSFQPLVEAWVRPHAQGVEVAFVEVLHYLKGDTFWSHQVCV